MDLDALMRAAGPAMQALQQSDGERANVRLTGRAGGGAVEIVLTGALASERVRITPAAAAAAGGDVTLLEDLIAAALNDALRQYRQRFGGTAQEQLQKQLAGNPLLAGLMPSLPR
jgi:nucleoid-associated protein EbfC